MTGSDMSMGHYSGSNRWADLGLLTLLAAIIVLACVAFTYEGPGIQFALEPEAQLALPPRQILLSLGEPENLDSERGEQIYRLHCLPCHGADGNLGLAGARRFGLEPFQNTTLGPGAHPVSLFDTLQNGFRKMIPQNHLSVGDRIAVIQHVRERLVRDRNRSEYVDLTRLLEELEGPEQAR